MWITRQWSSVGSCVEPDIATDGSDHAYAESSSVPSGEPNVRQRPIIAAMSWLMACIIEGFAAVAYAHYPCFTDQADRIAPPDWKQDARHVRDQQEADKLWPVREQSVEAKGPSADNREAGGVRRSSAEGRR